MIRSLTRSALIDRIGWSPSSHSRSPPTDDQNNRLSSSDRGAVSISYAHDKANRMTTLAANSQFYDLAGNLTVGYSADRGTSYKYSYDHLNRVTAVGKITGGSNPNWTTSAVAAFAYDAFGRRIEATDHVRCESALIVRQRK